MNTVPFSTSRKSGSDYLLELSANGINGVELVENLDLENPSTALPSLGLLILDSEPSPSLQHSLEKLSELKIPLFVMVPGDQLPYLQRIQEWADFVILPPRPREILTRVKRVIDRARPILKDQVNVRDLTINTTTYEVTVNGRRVNLRFKEYELLLLMATNPGRVYTREALLKNIWGFDYLGGTRTVDVHIRRLRSKIEDADHLFIETVWNVGYRFKTV